MAGPEGKETWVPELVWKEDHHLSGVAELAKTRAGHSIKCEFQKGGG